MRAVLLAAVLALAGCSAHPDYFLLPPPAAVARQPSPAASVAVAELSLPSYAEALEIATLTGPGQLDLVKNALWADTPRRALTRHLVAALEARLGGPVLTEPWPGFDPPARRVEVIVDRMIGAPGGGLEFAGQFVVVAPESGRLLAAERFALSVPPQGEGYPGLLAAHGRAVEQLADRIAARIAGRPAA
jgi:uncharacterized lipoprotein YmbA